jgi:NitT/TauT family transport system substrate-binding protein
VKVSWHTFNGLAAVNDALLSGSIDIAAGGTPGLLLLWAREADWPVQKLARGAPAPQH